MALSKSDICSELAASTGMGKLAIKHVLEDLAELATEQLFEGESFTVPGIAKISYAYTAPQAKGSKFSKGETITNPFTGEARVADSDSPARKAKVAMKLSPVGVVRKYKPGTKPEVQAAFLKTRAGKNLAKRSA